MAGLAQEKIDKSFQTQTLPRSTKQKQASQPSLHNDALVVELAQEKFDISFRIPMPSSSIEHETRRNDQEQKQISQQQLSFQESLELIDLAESETVRLSERRRRRLHLRFRFPNIN